jgi:hypothetical protein
MGADFKILTHINGNCLHLKLVGRLDSVSAGQLVDLVKRYIQKVSTVIIHTNSIKRDIQSGYDNFRNDLLLLRKQPVRFIFTGEHASLFG